MAGDINRVTLVGRLTRDPELRHLPSGSPVLQLGVACNGRQKDEAGNWTGIDGRLDWSSWEAQDGSKRSKVEIVAFQVQFLDSRGDSGEGGQSYIPQSDVNADRTDFAPAGAAASTDDDIPF
jgi:single-strand DNA-binding protein